MRFASSILVALLLFVGFFIDGWAREDAEDEGVDCETTQPTKEVAPDDEWEYEPRIWSMDETQPPGDEFGNEEANEGAAIWRDQSAEDSQDSSSSSTVEPIEMTNPHRLQHFVGNKNVKQQVYVNSSCDQFRVDIRDAVICDKKRCDKLDFEWPKHDNQLVLIETTKHGMRFHRAEFAFAASASRQAESKLDASLSGSSRVKFDLLELFKPKPSTTTAEPATQAPTTKPDEPTTTTAATTTTMEAETTTTELDSETPTTPGEQPQEEKPDPAGLREQDSNNTQLVTTFRLDTRRRRQKIVGFGGALSDSTCRNIRSLSAEMAKSLMEDYYGERGLRYNMARISVGSSDFSTSPYTNNDKVPPSTADSATNNRRRAIKQQKRMMSSDNLTRMAADNIEVDDDDLEMKNFRLTEEDYLYKLPVLRQAIATSTRQLKVFGSLWSPPVWMKNNSNIVHGYLKGDVYGPYYKALAELMLKWLEAYRKNGIEMWGFTGMNEPVTGVKPFIFHNSLGIARDDYITFFKLYLGPMMRQRGFPNVKLMIVDDNKGYMPNWAKTFLRDSEAAKYISGVAVHWYMNDEYENLDFISKYHPDKFILATEACNGYLPFQVHALPGDWDRGVAYMYDITKMLQKNSVGWVDWNMALDLSGGPSWIKNHLDAAVIVNARRDEYYKSPMFYAIGHFSRFVEPDSVRLDSRLANARYDYPLEAVAFQSPNNFITIVALNANKHAVPFRVIVDRKLVRVITLRADSFNTIVFKWKSQPA